MRARVLDIGWLPAFCARAPWGGSSPGSVVMIQVPGWQLGGARRRAACWGLARAMSADTLRLKPSHHPSAVSAANKRTRSAIPAACVCDRHMGDRGDTCLPLSGVAGIPVAPLTCCEHHLLFDICRM